LKKNLFLFVYLSDENKTLFDETTPSPSENLHTGILKKSPDENTTQPIETIQRKQGLFSSNFPEIFQ
jgi:hypothetical protein